MRKLYRKRAIKLTAYIPTDEEESTIAGFIEDALQCWGGQMHPDEPLFESLSVKSITIGNTKYICKGKGIENA
jgi:hypothetical protein